MVNAELSHHVVFHQKFARRSHARATRASGSRMRCRSAAACVVPSRLPGLGACGAVRGARGDLALPSTIDGPSAGRARARRRRDGRGRQRRARLPQARRRPRARVRGAASRGGRWQPPQRVDAGQSFDSSWPRIGAGNGGRLVVTWVQEFGANSDRLFSASLDPGRDAASRRRVPIDLERRRGDRDATRRWR